MDGKTKVSCLVCGKEFEYIVYHLVKHNLSTREYLEAFPSALLLSDEARQNNKVRGERISAAKLVWNRDHPEFAERQRERMKKHNPLFSRETQEKVSQSLKKYFANPANREEIGKCTKRGMFLMSNEDKKDMIEKMKAGLREHWNTITPQERKEFGKKVSEGARKSVSPYYTFEKRSKILKQVYKDRPEMHEECRKRFKALEIWKYNTKESRKKAGESIRKFFNSEKGQKVIQEKLNSSNGYGFKKRYSDSSGNLYRSKLEAGIANVLHELSLSFSYEKIIIRSEGTKWFINDFFVDSLNIDIEGAGMDWLEEHRVATEEKTRLLEKRGVRTLVVRNLSDLRSLKIEVSRILASLEEQKS